MQNFKAQRHSQMNTNIIQNIIPRAFYLSEDVVALAKSLLGKLIYTNTAAGITSAMIVETEAYRGPDDRGCHAYAGRYTDRTKTMYMEGGTAYVYMCYGVHPMFNVVTGPEGHAHAVLIRALQPVSGSELMRERRGTAEKYGLTSGPGKLTVAMGITREMDGTCLYDAASPVQLMDTGMIVQEQEIIYGPRVGMSRHVGSCSHRPWRFYIRGNPWVSKPLKVDYTGKW